MDVVDLLAIVYWPLVALTAVAFGRWFKRCGDSAWRRGWWVVAAVLAVFAFAVFLGFLGHHSAIVYLDWHILSVVLGLTFLTPLTIIVWLRLRSRTGKLPLALAPGGLIGAAFLSYGLWQITGDFLLRHKTVEAKVTELKTNMSRGGVHYHVYLDGKHHPTTAVVYDTLQVGDRVRASVSVTSGTISSVEHAREPAATSPVVTEPRSTARSR